MAILGATAPPRFPIGESDYRDLRRNGHTYVDKTLWIADILAHPAKVHIVPRPRRFGKTLNMSTLRYFVEQTPEDRTDLFEDTAIWTAEGGGFRPQFQRYPVIYLSFKDLKAPSWAELWPALQQTLSEELDRSLAILAQHNFVPTLPSDLSWLAQLRGDASPMSFAPLLRKLNAWFHLATGQQTFVLIDEYDAPLHGAWNHGYWDQAVGFFRNFLSAGLEDNDHLYKGVLTGILKVAKEGIFSGLNHPDTATILSSFMANRFGFTESEVAALADVAGAGDRLSLLQQWYNGYTFGRVPPHTMYNPWSILKYLSAPQDGPQAFWKNTSDNELIRSLLIRHAGALGTIVEALLQGESIRLVVDENVAMPQLADSPDTALGLLFFSGYLTASSVENTNNGLLATLRIPNLEVRHVFATIFAEWLYKGVSSAALAGGPGPVADLTQAMLCGDVDVFEEKLEERLVAMLSYHDVAGERVEAVYQAFLVGMLVHLEATHRVYSNREAGLGRADVLVVPRQPGAGAVLELKRITRRETPESALDKAVAQLTDRAYAAEVRAGGATTVHQYAVVFDGKRCWLRMVPVATAV